jgi:hypothetical protein
MFQRKVHPCRPAVSDRNRPPWRLLVETPDPALAISNFDAFREAGFEVTVCEGPAVDARECPVVRGEPCPLVADADVVLFDLDSDLSTRSQVLAATRANRPNLPIVVRSAAPATADSDTTIRPTTSVGGQVSALQKAVLRGPMRLV